MVLLSHPVNGGETPLLSRHLLKVAEHASELARQVKGVDEETTYFTGLLHDFGKLNPHYQEPFAKGKPPCPDCDYIPYHSVFSAFACDQQPLKRHRGLATMCIYGHHSSLRQSAELSRLEHEDKQKLKYTIDAINKRSAELLDELRRDVKAKNLLPKDIQIEQMEFHERDVQELKKSNDFDAFFEACCIYSALLQADRGAVTEWKEMIRPLVFGLSFDTDRLIKGRENKLTSCRTRYHRSVFENENFEDRLLVLQAPTGIGKTRVFLDIINRIAEKKKFERVFYFSPLLALSEDFEHKLEETIDPDRRNRVLKYDHTFKGTLEKEEPHQLEYEDNAYGGWDFSVESFNFEMIITTTQRLLYTLFSNRAHDKIKLLSLKHSILVIDEIQTLPRSLLLPTLRLLELVCERMDSMVILVSATIPAELETFPKARKIEAGNEVSKDYLHLTRKVVRYVDQQPAFEEEGGRRLKMFNTRREAARNAKDADFYLSAGVRKKDRLGVLEGLASSSDCLAVSTQVLEAGVDVSFDFMWRQLAPLDNIVQAMGRLNRECTNERSYLTVFDWSDEGPLSHRPYGQLEFEVTREFFKRNRETESTKIYEYLPDYYREIMKRNKKYEKKAENLSQCMKQLEFSKVWEKVKRETGEEGFTVFIPPKERFDELVGKVRLGKFPKELYFYSAKMPFLQDGQTKKRFEELLDQELLEKGVYIGCKKGMDELYDEKLGLDKWLIK